MKNLISLLIVFVVSLNYVQSQHLTSQLDSITVYKREVSSGPLIHYTTYTYEYDFRGNVSAMTTYDYNVYTFAPMLRDEYVFNNDNQLTELKNFRQIYTDTMLRLEIHNEYVYDGSGVLIEHRQASANLYSSNYLLKPMHRFRYTYTQTGLLDSLYHDRWKPNLQDYEAYTVTKHNYGPTGLITDKEAKRLQQGPNPVHYRERYYYTPDWLLKKHVTETYDPIYQKFDTNRVRNYTYNLGNRIISKESIYPDGSQSYEKEEYAYDIEDDLICIYLYKRNYSSNQFQLYLASEHHQIRNPMHANSHIALDKAYRYFSPSEDIQLQQTYRVDTSYLHNIMFNDVIEQTIFHYAPFTYLAIAQSDKTKAKVYPNPTQDVVYFDSEVVQAGSLLTLYDIHGRSIRSIRLKDDKSVSIADLPPGIYIYQIAVQNQVITGKLIRN